MLIRAGRVFCAETGIDGPGAVALRGDRIAAAGPDVVGEAGTFLEFPDCLLLPGLVGMHAHHAPPDWKYGIDPDELILPRGSTTILSQGDTGAADWPFYRDSVIGGASIRILMALSPAVHGKRYNNPTYANLGEVDVDDCVDTIMSADESIWGIAVNVAAPTCGDNDPRVILNRVLQAAERTGKPFLYGVRWDPFDWPLEEQLERLRPGDVVTYCMHEGKGGIAPQGRVADAVWKARERAVLFDHRPRYVILRFRCRGGRHRRRTFIGVTPTRSPGTTYPERSRS
jgi:dihydroorotase